MVKLLSQHAASSAQQQMVARMKSQQVVDWLCLKLPDEFAAAAVVAAAMSDVELEVVVLALVAEVEMLL